ncbi:hypothetical protein [Acidaminococcus timonensis]|jgi:hypothetical protein|uniref:hypothetical protein n=1 Tax=Acidaminococcus timonensis TaxID=1871002 RepID=UPI003A5BFDA0
MEKLTLRADILPQPYALLAASIGDGLADLLTAPGWRAGPAGCQKQSFHRQRFAAVCCGERMIVNGKDLIYL